MTAPGLSVERVRRAPVSDSGARRGRFLAANAFLPAQSPQMYDSRRG
jgi:hypothetical protein